MADEHPDSDLVGLYHRYLAVRSRYGWSKKVGTNPVPSILRLVQVCTKWPKIVSKIACTNLVPLYQTSVYHGGPVRPLGTRKIFKKHGTGHEKQAWSSVRY